MYGKFFYFYCMKKIFVGSLSFLVIGLGGCSKKYTCRHNIYYDLPTHVLFNDFAGSDIDTLVITRIKSASDSVIAIDTVVTQPVESNGILWPDTTFVDGFTNIKVDENIRVFLPSINRTISITGAKKGISEGVFESEEPCSPGAGQARILPPTDIKIDGKAAEPVDLSTKSYRKYIIVDK